jgi:hypothetical protein
MQRYDIGGVDLVVAGLDVDQDEVLVTRAA